MIDVLRSGFADPPVTAAPMMRWWWFGPSVDRDELSRELTAMAGAGFGGVEVACVHPLGPATTDFMSDAFLAAGCRLCRSRLDPAATGVLPSATSRRRHDQGSRWRWHPAGATGVSAADRSERQAGCGHRPQHRSQRVSDRPAHHRAGRAERSSLRAQIPDAGSRQSHGVRTVPVAQRPSHRLEHFRRAELDVQLQIGAELRRPMCSLVSSAQTHHRSAEHRRTGAR
jgi:hypothetical protein